jgi:hypothetical protein
MDAILMYLVLLGAVIMAGNMLLISFFRIAALP